MKKKGDEVAKDKGAAQDAAREVELIAVGVLLKGATAEIWYEGAIATSVDEARAVARKTGELRLEEAELVGAKDMSPLGVTILPWANVLSFSELLEVNEPAPAGAAKAEDKGGEDPLDFRE